MRLADFILAHREPILAEWEAFARTCKPASGTMDVEALRDHADQMLTVIAADLKAPQDSAEQAEKSKGRAPAEDQEATTAAEEHGGGRAESGFSVEQMVAEYRALRASVIRLWTKEKGQLVPEDVEDLTRFNEAIDQSLAESVAEYNHGLEQSKEIFLAILGHDMRTPLGAIYSSARFMLELDELQEPHRTLTERIANSATRTIQMVGELLDFTRSRLGGSIPVVRAEVDLGRLVRDVVVSAAHPGCRIQVDTRGHDEGEWDEAQGTRIGCPGALEISAGRRGQAHGSRRSRAPRRAPCPPNALWCRGRRTSRPFRRPADRVVRHSCLQEESQRPAPARAVAPPLTPQQHGLSLGSHELDTGPPVSIFLSPLDHILTNRGKVRLLRALTPLSRPVSGREAAKLARRLSQTPALRALDDLVALGVLRRTETPSQHLYEVNRAHQLVREGLEPLFRAEQERIGRVLDVLSEVAPRASIRRRRSDTGRWENHCSEAPGPWSSSRTWIGR